jgi:HrpA-like RNA helicase
MLARHTSASETKQSILVFLPGEAEIRRTEDMLNAANLPPRFRAASMGRWALPSRMRRNPAPEGSGKSFGHDHCRNKPHREGIGTVNDTG